MRRLSGNLLVQFAVVSLVAMLALAILLSGVLTARLGRNVELLEDHGAAMMSGTMIMPEAPYSIPSLTDNIQQFRLIVYGSVAGALALLYALLTGIVWRGWRTIVRGREALQETAEENAFIARVGRIVSSSLSVGDVYQGFAAEVQKIIPCDNINVNIVDLQNQTFTIAYVAGHDVPGRRMGDTAHLVGTLTGAVVRAGSGVLQQTENEDGLLRRYPALLSTFETGLRSFLAVPLISQDEVVGTLHLQSKTPNAYNEHDLSLAEKVGSQIAGAIANDALRSSLEREAKDRESLAEIGRIISSSLHIDDVFERFASTVGRLLHFDRLNIDTVDLDEGTFTSAFVSGIDVPGRSVGDAHHLRGSLAEDVIRKQRGVIVQGSSEEDVVQRFPALAPALRAGLQSILVAPLTSRDRVIGLLGFQTSRSASYSQRDLDMAERVAHQIGGAVATAQLYERLEKAVVELQQTQEELIRQERLRALGQLASGVAHDFNNALTPIVGFAQLLLDRPENLEDKDKTRRYLETISTAATGAADVVSRLREFYRAPDESHRFAKVDLKYLVTEVIALTETKWKDDAQANGIDIRIESDVHEVEPVQGDKNELRQMLINLIFNAVDAMPDGGPITLRARAEGAHVVLEVQDTGIGMSQEVKKRCLDPFFTTKGNDGTGMGLAMVYGTVRRHGGSMDIESDEGSGTTFILRLPIGSETEEDETHVATAVAQQGLHILLVDDEPAVRALLAAYLDIDGHTVDTAENGKEGLDKSISDDFDLILTDRAMPQMSGDQLAAAVRAVKPTPIILLTGFGDLMRSAGERPKGVDLVLGKPVTMSSLREAVAMVTSDHTPSYRSRTRLADGPVRLIGQSPAL